ERLPSAHDMVREYRIISALYGSRIPVPKPLAISNDVLPVEVYAMEFVPGRVLRTREDAHQLPLDSRRRVGLQLVSILAELHALDPNDVGLGDLGAGTGYFGRQLRRWHGQWQRQGGRSDLVERLYAEL